MKNTLLIFVLLLSCLQLLAQDFDVPKNFNPKDKSDYAKFNNDVLKCINYLENSPLDKNDDKRKEVISFLVEWISGSPDVQISIISEVVGFIQKNPELLIIYMGGWAKYAIENNDYKDNIKGNLAGIKSVIKVYNGNKSVKKDKNIERLIKLDKNGELEKYEADLMKTQK